MEEIKDTSRHEQLKYRLRNRIDKELFEHMPEEIQDYLIELDPADVKEAYLTAMLKLPWAADRTLPPIELGQAKKNLDATHYAMIDVKEKVLRYMACQKHLGKSYGSVLLLVGVPGVGKTSIAASIARAMGRPCVKISMAGVSDALFLRGAQTIFKDARPGRIVDALSRAKCFNPLIMFDEIDKMGESIEHGSPENVLLDILDSDRSKFVDNYLGFPLDLSDIIFIATANSIEKLSPVLLDRMDIVELPSYTPYDKEKIVTGYVWPRLIKEYQLEGLCLKADAVEILIELCPEEGVRDLERICRKLCESVISIYYADGERIESVDANNLPRLLGRIYYKE